VTDEHEQEFHSENEAFAYLYRTYFGDHVIEKDEIARLPELLVGTDLFIDAGASLGQYTYFANKAMRDGRIIAIEADPERFAELERNCSKWEAEGSNKITAINAAVGDGHDPITFYITSSQISGGFFPVPERSDLYHPIEVAQVTLDDYFESGVRTLIKIDTEGGEFRAMRGSEAHIQGGDTRFILEIAWWGDRERKTNAREILKFLRSRRLHMKKLSHRHSSNYLISKAAPGESVTSDYVKAAPILLAKAYYGRWVPQKVRLARERAMNTWRKRRHAAKNS
jgi:FkbM family methyltransferase